MALLSEIKMRKEKGGEVWYLAYLEETTIWQRLHSAIKLILGR